MNSHQLLNTIKTDAIHGMPTGYVRLVSILDAVICDVETDITEREINASEKALVLGALVWCIAGFIGGAVILALHAWSVLQFNDLAVEDEDQEGEE